MVHPLDSVSRTSKDHSPVFQCVIIICGVRSTRFGHKSNIRIFKGICDLLQMLRMSNFPVCFTLENTDIQKNGYRKNK